MIRVAKKEDAEAISAIYRPYVEKTTFSFETAAPDAFEMERRISETLQSYPWLVLEENGMLTGYAYASPMGSRAAYMHSADVSIYVKEGSLHRGAGKRLYSALERLLPAQNITLLLAVVTDRNLASVAFHKSMGYGVSGHIENCGLKFGTILGIYHLTKELPHEGLPADLIPFSRLGAAWANSMISDI